ncbi:MAG: hypothetical protein R3244_06655 [Thermoanaerobaculia bacterium]|nr:hypothetical protein [Thermoanaerobaculia bacterium]
MHRSHPVRRALPTVVGIALLLLGTPLFAAEMDEEVVPGPDSDAPLPGELLEARTVLLLDTSMHFALSSEFVEALDEWGRLEQVYLPDEADICFALSTRPDFTKQALPGEGEGTVRVIDKLYFRVFVPGQERTLWRDEVDLDDETPTDLILRLQERIEQQTAEEPAAPGAALADRPMADELLGARKILVLTSATPFTLANEFRDSLEAWGRFEQVFLPDEADVCLRLDAPVEYASQELATGSDDGGSEGGDSGDAQPDERAVGTQGVIQTLYLKVFVPGQGLEYLWEDEIDAAVDDPARQLVERLRSRMALAEGSAATTAAEEG